MNTHELKLQQELLIKLNNISYEVEQLLELSQDTGWVSQHEISMRAIQNWITKVKSLTAITCSNCGNHKFIETHEVVLRNKPLLPNKERPLEYLSSDNFVYTCTKCGKQL